MVVPDGFQINVHTEGAAQDAESARPGEGGGCFVVFVEVVFGEAGLGVGVDEGGVDGAPFGGRGEVQEKVEGQAEACAGFGHVRWVIADDGGELVHGSDAGFEDEGGCVAVGWFRVRMFDACRRMEGDVPTIAYLSPSSSPSARCCKALLYVLWSPSYAK